MGIVVSYSGGKAASVWNWPLLFSAEFRNKWSSVPPPPPKGMPAWRTQGQHNFHAMNKNLGGPQSSYLN